MVPLIAELPVVNSYSSSTMSMRRYGWFPSVGIFATDCSVEVVWVAFGPPLTLFSRVATRSPSAAATSPAASMETSMSNHTSGLRDSTVNAPSSPEKLEVNGLVNDWVNPSVTTSVPSLRASFSSLRLFFRISNP